MVGTMLLGGVHGLPMWLHYGDDLLQDPQYKQSVIQEALTACWCVIFVLCTGFTCGVVHLNWEIAEKAE